MAVLTKNAVAPISMQLKKPPVDAAAHFPWLKDLLTEGHGKTNRERLRQLLAGEKIGDRRTGGIRLLKFIYRTQGTCGEGRSTALETLKKIYTVCIGKSKY